MASNPHDPQAPRTSLRDTVQMLQSIFIADETMIFRDEDLQWVQSLDSGAIVETPESVSFSIFLGEWRKVWFVVTLHQNGRPDVLVKGEDIGRDEQLEWQKTVKDILDGLDYESEDFSYDLVTNHLLPILHEAQDENLREASPQPSVTSNGVHVTGLEDEHSIALFTSHHLISTQKRRSMQSWASALRIRGFAKIGYPGVIYAEGPKSSLDEFVSNIKGMQWLALRLRVLQTDMPLQNSEALGDWKEVQKIGEVVEEMKARGRVEHIAELGLHVSD